MSRITLITVGDKDHPATPENLDDVRQNIAAVMHEPQLSMVTHHSITFHTHPRETGQVRVFKLGDTDNKATDGDIDAFQLECVAAANEKRPIVWYHRVVCEVVSL